MPILSNNTNEFFRDEPNQFMFNDEEENNDNRNQNNFYSYENFEENLLDIPFKRFKSYQLKRLLVYNFRDFVYTRFMSMLEFDNYEYDSKVKKYIVDYIKKYTYTSLRKYKSFNDACNNLLNSFRDTIKIYYLRNRQSLMIFEGKGITLVYDGKVLINDGKVIINENN